MADMVLPGGLDGAELAMVARRLRPGLSVLYMSGYAEKRITDTAGDSGRPGFIATPFSKAEQVLQLCALLGENAQAA